MLRAACFVAAPRIAAEREERQTAWPRRAVKLHQHCMPLVEAIFWERSSEAGEEGGDLHEALGLRARRFPVKRVVGWRCVSSQI